jgi:hypothetical protein
MTLIIDMASGTDCEDRATIRTDADPASHHRLHSPGAETGLVLVPVATPRSTTGMPASLHDCDIGQFLDDMD